MKQSALFRKFLRRGAPGYIVRFWYARQSMCVRWGGSVSAKFNVSKWSETRRYPVAISIQYIHGRSKSRSEQVPYSLYSWEYRFVIFSPTEKGVSLLLDVCEKYGNHHNSKKSAVLVFRNSYVKNVAFQMNGKVSRVKYLGHCNI